MSLTAAAGDGDAFHQHVISSSALLTRRSQHRRARTFSLRFIFSTGSAPFF